MNFQVGDIIPDKSRHGWQVVTSVSEKELSILWCPTLYDCLKKTKKIREFDIKTLVELELKCGKW